MRPTGNRWKTWKTTRKAQRIRAGLPAIPADWSAEWMEVTGELPAELPTNVRTFEVSTIPSPTLTAEDILAHKRRVFARHMDYEQARKLVTVAIKMNGPIGILHMGDLHLDDDSCDIAAVERDMDLVLSTPGLYAGQVGDVTNNWIRALAHLYGRQSTTAEQAWELARWFFGKMGSKMLYLVGGNHDAWSGDRDVLKFIAEQTRTTMEPRDIRMSFNFPGGRSITMNAKHSHKGGSMWNPAHGQMKFAQKGVRDNIIISGHKHQSGYGIVVSPTDHRLCHCIQLASYEAFSEYARANDLPGHFISPSVVTVIDPDATSETGLITVFHDTKAAAAFLTYLRTSRGLA